MYEKWKGRYTIEATAITIIVMTILFLLIGVGIYRYNLCILKTKAAIFANSSQEQELPGVLLLDERITIEKSGDKVRYYLPFQLGNKHKVFIFGEKEPLIQVDMGMLRKWKYIKGDKHENK